ncbi:SpvB/TcaC N-terminal domain-containing protein [Candidatus Methylomirabilis sp.]|uniref:SpvB/TcaC N-terminal domain-containing protein n=1 Tax=Candidatus Methylomirabilis sp. TaxID=2032687 RepID=UPI0030764598
MASPDKATSRSDGEQKPTAPSISLPKGGGAIRGMGEKFAANPVTGTGSMSVPIAASPGRSGFGPQLSLSYDSGAGNGPFGFGWSLSLPSITRKTDKGLPRYQDADESDVFILSGAEDLVPVLIDKGGGKWEREQIPPRTVGGKTYRIQRYRPRIEGLFARIERWTNQADQADSFWRSISKDNITTWYGKTSKSRIADPSHVFSWLICESYDDKGNAIVYEYKSEDSQRIFEDQQGQFVAPAHERNRTDDTRKANRYLKRIYYGNRKPYLPKLEPGKPWPDPPSPGLSGGTPNWFFEVVFDYDDGHYAEDAPDGDGRVFARPVYSPPVTAKWKARVDPFSTYRAGFEIRTYRLCQRVLMFHHFPNEQDVGANCLVRSTDFTYSYEENPKDARNPIYSFLLSVSQCGYKRDGNRYLKRSLPPVEFEYTQPLVQDTVQDVDAESIENLPIGLDGAAYQWTDLHGEGIPGILTEQAGAWFYKRNLGPLPVRDNGSESVKARLAPAELVAVKPNLALAGGAQFMDLAGDGQPDVVVMEGPTPGLYEHDDAEGWQPFRPFTSRLNRDTRDPNLKFVDLDGDGHADVLISEDNAFVWHPSLAEEGFGSAHRVAQALDEEKGPRLVFADSTQSIYLADMSGDGLTDLVRIRNGEVCYWPNLGYGRFGAKVTMDNAPCFDNPDQFNHKRVRLADIDGSGTTDIIYLHRNGVRIYFNQSGNGWSQPHLLKVFPRIDDLVGIVPTDLLGNGTACLVWSSPLPGDARRPMRYVNLMGQQKPHLLVGVKNNIGAETKVQYAPSTKFYLQDKRDGKPWITRLPFPVHVVERVETYDHISRNRFVTRYAYHHGYFDGEEREFRGFGMVEQWDTEQFAALADGKVPADNIDAESHVPPVHTKTWFHTGVYLGRDHVSDYFAGLLNATDQGEYFREPGLTDAQARDLLLDDTVFPAGLTLAEEREACRALKGSMLRQEVYADDANHPGATPEEIQRAGTPYTVTEQNFSIRTLQPRGTNRHAVFFTHADEALSYHYERNPADPRIQHALTLEVDDYGNVLKQAAIGYGRRKTIRVVNARGQVQQVPNPGLAGLTATDQAKQTTALLTYTENLVGNPIESADRHCNPLPCETLTFELTGYAATGPAGRFQASDLVEPDPAAPGRLRHKFTDQVAYEAAPTGHPCRRPIEWLRTLYRRDDLSGLLPLGEVQPLSLPGESYKLAFTPGLLAQVFRRPRQGQADEPLLPEPARAAILGGQAGNRGGYLQSQALKADGRFPARDADDHWWIPSGQSFFTTNPLDAATTELAQARQHFFLPRRYRDPFGQDAFVNFDAYDLLMEETRDALGNRVSVEANDYRVLQPGLASDPNRNQTAVVFDTLGMVVGTAVMGKPLPAPVEGDTLTGFAADLTQAQLDGFFDAADPHVTAAALLNDATTRIVYDLDRFRRTRQANPNEPTKWQPACAATITRETHASDPLPSQGLKIQASFSYSDGFGREIQKKIQAEPGPVPEWTNGKIVVGPDGQPEMTTTDASPRWVGSGWTVFNNKGKPVRQYEPFFTDTHRFEFDVKIGVSPILFYDPIDRVVATLHPNHTWEKVVFDPWRQETWGVNDTVTARNLQIRDPKVDADVGDFFRRLPDADYLPTWHALRTDPANAVAFAARYPDSTDRANETRAAEKAAAHADTPTTAHFDALGRPFLTLTRNRVSCPNHPLDGSEDKFATRVELDIEGNQREVRDAIKKGIDPQGNEIVDERGRVVMRYDYDMLGNRIHQGSMEAGERWMLNDATGKPIRAWDSRGHIFRMAYDPLRRPVRSFVTGADRDHPDLELLAERLVYGEQHPEDEARNLRGKLYLHLDQAGAATTEAHDFKGNPLRATRRLSKEYKRALDWSAVDAALPADSGNKLDPNTLETALAPLLEDETFSSRTTYDALNRPIQLIAPHSDRPGVKLNVIQPGYNEANLLERVSVWLEETDEPSDLLVGAASKAGVTNIDYDAKGQRLRIDYANGASTFYEYDPLTFRLVNLHTKRDAAGYPGDCPQPPPEGWSGCQVQNLFYTYDPAGNITHIRDDAQQAIFFKNKRVEPNAEYTYDALYRLIEATGREHLGQAGSPIPHSHDDAPRVGIDWSANDGNAMGTYIERYVYDAVGNFLEMRHHGPDPANPGWTRTYPYNEPSLLESSKVSNRLSATTVSGNNLIAERYTYDAHGNMTRMPHLGGAHPEPNMHWDYKDQLIRADLGGGGTAYYVYDSAGQRARKVWKKSPSLIEERLYLGGFEIFRRHGGEGNVTLESVTLEREALHIMDDKQHIALVETRTKGTDPSSEVVIRYQLGNHLGSASLELDGQAQIISYEEYTPYGSTSYQAVSGLTETSKRYRYTGKERDEESGLYYHGARYYACWLGRWASSDPAGLIVGPNLYLYVRANPVRLIDSSGLSDEDEVLTHEDPSLNQCQVDSQSTESVPEGFAEWSREMNEAKKEEDKSSAEASKELWETMIKPQLEEGKGISPPPEDWETELRQKYAVMSESEKQVFAEQEWAIWRGPNVSKPMPEGFDPLQARIDRWGLDEAHNTGVKQGLDLASGASLVKGIGAAAVDRISLQMEGAMVSRGYWSASHEISTAGTQWGTPLRSLGNAELTLSGLRLSPNPSGVEITRIYTPRVLTRAAEVGARDLGHNFPVLLDSEIMSSEIRYLRPGGLAKSGSVTYAAPGTIGGGHRALEGYYEIGVLDGGPWVERIIHRSFTTKPPSL